jgi:hypothetical protein
MATDTISRERIAWLDFRARHPHPRLREDGDAQEEARGMGHCPRPVNEDAPQEGAG